VCVRALKLDEAWQQNLLDNEFSATPRITNNDATSAVTFGRMFIALS